MFRNMIRIGAGSKRRKHAPNAVRGRLRLRPTMMALEGRTLLSNMIVSNTNDSGLGSLRAAVAQANANRQADTIVFSSLFNSPQTIRLTSGALVLTNTATTTITGPGANLLTISGNKASRVFDLASGASAQISGLTVSGGSVHGNGGGVENTGGTLALADAVIRGNSARAGGGLFSTGTATLTNVVIRGNRASVGGGLLNAGTTTLTDVVMRGNTAPLGSSMFSTRRATLIRRGLSNPGSTGPILSQTFNGTGFPANWEQLPTGGTVVQNPQTHLTMTDSTGNQAGILSTLSIVPFNPQGVTTTIKAQISSVSVSPQVGNAIVGLIGPNGTPQPGTLAAGIDSQGNVFIIEYDPAQKIAQPNIVPVGVDKAFNGQSPVTMTLTISSTGVQITAGAIKFREFSFSKDLNNFSLKTAFPNGAVPALVAASQQGQKGGVASFESISVSTA